MLPFIPLALAYAPQLLKTIFGERGRGISNEVAAAIQAVTGVDPTTPDGVTAVQTAVKADPKLEAQLQQKLAEIAEAREAEANREAGAARQAELEDLKVQVADIGNARQQTMTLAAEHSPLAFGAPVLSGIILVAFATMLLVLLTGQNSLNPNMLSLVNIMLGTLAAMATQVANYWLGSSSGSTAKNTMLANAQHALWLSTPPASIIAASPVPGVAVPAPKAAADSSRRAQSPSPDELNQRSLAAARMSR
jgi:hypothetical protein